MGYSVDYFVDFSVTTDLKNSSWRILDAVPVFKLITALSVIGILVTAAFFLRMIQKVFLGPLNEKWNDLKDMSFLELASIAPLTALTVLIGVWPHWLIRIMDVTVQSMVNFVHGVK